MLSAPSPPRMSARRNPFTPAPADPGTTMRIELDVFGSDNAATLARLFRAGEALTGKDADPTPTHASG